MPDKVIIGSLRNRTAEWRKNVSRDCAFPVLHDMFSSFCHPESSNSFKLKQLVTMVSNARWKVLNKWVATLSFHTTLLGSTFPFTAPSSWIILMWLTRKKSSKISPKTKVRHFHRHVLLFTRRELELHASAIIWLNYVHTNERSIYAMLKLFEWMNVFPFWFWARNFVPKLLGLLPCWG